MTPKKKYTKTKNNLFNEKIFRPNNMQNDEITNIIKLVTANKKFSGTPINKYGTDNNRIINPTKFKYCKFIIIYKRRIQVRTATQFNEAYNNLWCVLNPPCKK